MHGDRLLLVKALMKILTLQQLRNGVLRHQSHEIVGRQSPHPAAIEIDHRLFRIENLEDLLFIRLRILLDLLAAERRPRHRPSRRVANHPGEVANQKNRRVPQILKVLQLAQHDRVPQMQVGRGRVHSQLHPQRFARGARLLQLCPQIGLADNLRRALFQIRQLFVYRCEGWHGNPLL